MAKSNDKPNCINGAGIFHSGDVTRDKTSIKYRSTQTTTRRRSGEVVEMFKCRSVDICCLQELDFGETQLG